MKIYSKHFKSGASSVNVNTGRTLVSNVIYRPVADDVYLMPCSLNHIKAPLVWAVCGLPLRPAGDRGNKLAFLTLAQVFLPPSSPPVFLPVLHLVTSKVSWMTKRLGCPSQWGNTFKCRAHADLQRIMGTEVLFVCELKCQVQKLNLSKMFSSKELL